MIDDAAATHVKKINDEIGIQWLYSFLSNDKRKTYCLYEAPSLMLTPSVWPRSGSACPLMRSSK